MTSEIKKKIVLGVLFIFPIVIYLFFASGKNNFAKLPVLSEDVLELDIFKSFEERKVRLKDKITILGYWGDNLNFKKAEALNLNEKIYKRFYEFNDLQFVIIMQENKESEIKLLKNELRDGAGTNLLKWNFLTSSKENIERHFNSLKIPLILEKNLSSPYVFIIDKEKKLRGRNDDEDIGVLYGFDARSVAEINKKMIDDVKVILAEYRLALKRYNKVQRN
tara:strand:+ start:1178 stop:1840 length:663 start_codon:yes stop_codon:yes gene_type:complete